MDESERIVTFKTYYDPMLAHIVRGRLEANEIECFIAHETAINLKPYLIQAMGGVSICVFKKDEQHCRDILSADGSIDDIEERNQERAAIGVMCPYCGSDNVRYGAATIPKFHLPSLIASLFFFVPLYFRNAWHCFNCHCEFDNN